MMIIFSKSSLVFIMSMMCLWCVYPFSDFKTWGSKFEVELELIFAFGLGRGRGFALGRGLALALGI